MQDGIVNGAVYALLALAIVGGYAIGWRYLELGTATWYRVGTGDQMSLTPAGYWYLIVSLTIFRFILLHFYITALWTDIAIPHLSLTLREKRSLGSTMPGRIQQSGDGCKT